MANPKEKALKMVKLKVRDETPWPHFHKRPASNAPESKYGFDLKHPNGVKEWNSKNKYINK